jgi:hypothetical protein
MPVAQLSTLGRFALLPFMTHCCTKMTEAVSSACAEHPDRFDCPDALIHYSPRSRSFGIIVHDGGSSSVSIEFCPWCGSQLGRRTKKKD